MFPVGLSMIGRELDVGDGPQAPKEWKTPGVAETDDRIRPALFVAIVVLLVLLVIVVLALVRDGGGRNPGDLGGDVPCPANGPPEIRDTLVATIAGEAVIVRGCSLDQLDDPAATLDGAEVVLADQAATSLTFSIPDDAVSGTLRIDTEPDTQIDDTRLLVELPIEIYDYESTAIPQSRGTNAKALSIAIDAQGTAWVNQEFHRDLHKIEDGQVTAYRIPVPSTPIFATMTFGDGATDVSVLGEDIEVGPNGAIWFTEGGGSLYSGVFPNHSRIVRFDPDSEEFAAFNVPGDGNEVIGMAFDDQGTIWFAQAGQDQAAIVNFDPSAVQPDNLFDFSTSLDDQLCDDIPAGCFRSFPLDNSNVHPAHLVIDDDGRVWFTAFFGNSLGSLDPETGEIHSYSLASTDETEHRRTGSGPWQIALDPPGGLVFNEFFNNRVGWFDRDRASADPGECAGEDGQDNDCVEARRVAVSADATETASDESAGAIGIDDVDVHSIAIGGDGRAWFTVQGESEDTPSSVGFVVNREEVHLLPSLRQVDPSGGGGQTGIAIDPTNGDIWFTEFFNNSVGRLRLR